MACDMQKQIETAPFVELSSLIDRVERENTNLKYGSADVRGVSNTKGFINTRANIDGRSFKRFLIVEPGEFVFNRRTTRNGERLGLGFNMTNRDFILTEDYVCFRIKPSKKEIISPYFLYIYFLRDEFDRYVRSNSWGSATEFFNWDDMCRVKIPLPPIAVQLAYVNAYKGLTALIEQNEALVETLERMAQAELLRSNATSKKYILGDFISETNERNSDELVDDVRGISTVKRFREPNSRVDKTKLSNYKIVKNMEFAYVPTTDTWRCLATCLSDIESPIVVSPIYVTFKVKEGVSLLPEYLQLFFRRKETDRYARFNSWGSARENFNWDDMCRIKIPLPSIEKQRAIVALYHCAEEARKIAAEAKAQLAKACPAMIQKAAHAKPKVPAT